MDFFVEAGRGHDDYLMSLALLIKAAEYLQRIGKLRERYSINSNLVIILCVVSALSSQGGVSWVTKRGI